MRVWEEGDESDSRRGRRGEPSHSKRAAHKCESRGREERDVKNEGNER